MKLPNLSCWFSFSYIAMCKRKSSNVNPCLYEMCSTSWKPSVDVYFGINSLHDDRRQPIRLTKFCQKMWILKFFSHTWKSAWRKFYWILASLILLLIDILSIYVFSWFEQISVYVFKWFWQISSTYVIRWFWCQKINFWQFLKNADLAKNLTIYSDRFLVNFLKMYTFYTLPY